MRRTPHFFECKSGFVECGFICLSSRGYFRPGFSIFDTFWAALAPLLALYVRGAYILSIDGAATAALYCGISFAFALIAFVAFRLNDGISRYFSVHDAVNILKASLVAGLMTALILFTFTRLEEEFRVQRH